MKKNNLWKLAGALALTAVLAGCSSSISQEEATTIALEHAGVAKEDAVSLSVQQEYEDGRDIFEVKFSTQDTEYSYDVAQKDGEIINYNYDSTGTPPAGASEGSSASGTEVQAVQEEIDKAQQDQSAAESQAKAVEDAIDQATAENIALEHAGVTECYMHRVELDTEDGREVYEIEFFSGNTEYDYTVARDTGEILSYDQATAGRTARGTAPLPRRQGPSPWRKRCSWCWTGCPGPPPRMCASSWRKRTAARFTRAK